ncbi:MAG: FAD-dependent oxidoreductase [Myxococcota bacterium]
MPGSLPSVVVVGGGTMGLASAWAMARRGMAVTVLERHRVVNTKSSHGGFTRIIRQAYHEGSDYVPLIVESEREWLALQSRRDEPLLVRTGLIEFGPSDHPELAAAIEVCEAMAVRDAQRLDDVLHAVGGLPAGAPVPRSVSSRGRSRRRGRP